MCKGIHMVWMPTAITNQSNQSIIFEGSRLQKCGCISMLIPVNTSTSPSNDLWEKNPERCYKTPVIGFVCMCEWCKWWHHRQFIHDVTIQDDIRMSHQVGAHALMWGIRWQATHEKSKNNEFYVPKDPKFSHDATYIMFIDLLPFVYTFSYFISIFKMIGFQYIKDNH